MKKTYFLMMLLPALYFSQTVDERRKIASQSDIVGNATQLDRLKKEESERKIRLSNYFSKNPKIQKIIKNGEFGISELIDVSPSGELAYLKTYNDGASKTARANRLYNGGSLGLNIQGQGMIAGIWDGGSVRSTHQEFNVGGVSKITLMDGSAVANHATHVGGTISAQGIGSILLRGVAFNSSLKSYDWNSDLVEMNSEASAGMLVSNHSYGPDLTQGSNPAASRWVLGAYRSDARETDEVCKNNPFYLPVFAAGNSRDDANIPYITQISNKSGYDMIGGQGIAKNVLTVGAVYELLNYTVPSDVQMSTFSSWGPTDDGRIKPEIVMKGVAVRSSTSTSDTSSGFNQGTSMAAPGVTGVVLLLQQYYNQLYSSYMRAATVKGLIMHSADEAGENPGPDYSYGWGLINAENAAKIIRDKNLLSNRTLIEENILSNGATFTKSISSNGSQPLRISISWTDPQYQGQNSGTTDPVTKYLVNDLDLKVTSASGTVYYPWKLQGMTNYAAPATNNSTNDADNFERVDIPLPAGNYTISVTHKGNLTGGSPQNFSLIASGSNLATLSTNDSALKENKIDIYPNPAGDWVNFKNINGVVATVVILDMSGKLIKKESVSNDKISVKDLPKGQYMLIYTDKKSRDQSFKFIKL